MYPDRTITRPRPPCRAAWRWRAAVALLSLLAMSGPGAGESGCADCHPQKVRGFMAGHAFGAERCEACHGGDPSARALPQAHSGLVAFPGELASAERTCGACHAEQVRSVRSGPMAKGRNMVSVTRFAFGEQPGPGAGRDGLDSLGHTPADSLLRKLCASCHLGQEKTAHAHDVVADRGGGCAACHVNRYPADAHPALTRRVEDGRCFGCHSRSSRVALSYAGLAEAGPSASPQRERGLLRLGDGRLLRRLPADTHHAAGLACIDCHTGTGLMGGPPGEGSGAEVDIACADCHANPNPRVPRAGLPDAQRPQTLPFDGPADQPFLATAAGTPLWHVEVRPDGPDRLYLKNRPDVLPIPPLDPAHHPEGLHDRLSCTACHSTWAPQCNGCHIRYEPDLPQWDHAAREFTDGRWVERRWGFRQHAPTLGVDADGRIAPFVPGMILTLEHPDWDEPRFRRLFAPLAPHTTGPSRECRSCHLSPLALGLGTGRLFEEDGHWRFDPDAPRLEDGLPADAWTALDGAPRGEATREGARPLSPAEIRRVLEATGADP